jgi:hypothetical protein
LETFQAWVQQSAVIGESKAELKKANDNVEALERRLAAESNELARYKNMVLKKVEEIDALQHQLAHSETMIDFRPAEDVNEAKEQEDTISRLQEDLAEMQSRNSSLELEIGQLRSSSGAKPDLPSNEMFRNLVVTDPTVASDLWPMPGEDDNLFESWRKSSYAEHVTSGVLCMWCQCPFGPESASILGTCGHVWHHACLEIWLRQSRRCCCRMQFDEREYAQRNMTGIHVPLLDPESASSTPAMIALSEASQRPIDSFTVNESNLSDNDFDLLMLTGRFQEWKDYAAAHQISHDEANLSRAIRAHRRSQRREELDTMRNLKNLYMFDDI